MASRENLLSKIWRKLLAKRAKPAPLRADKPAKRQPASTLEPLEGRIAPAVLVNPTTITFHDLDNDLVTVHFSKAINANNTSPGSVFSFADADGNEVAFGFDGPQQLQLINLLAVNSPSNVSPVNGTSITVTATPLSGENPGDGFTNIGAIRANGLALATVSIDGDLGQIVAGGVTSKTAIKLLSANSIGAAADSQGDDPNFQSTITGGLGALKIAGDVKGFINVVDRNDFSGRTLAAGSIGSITVGGSLIGDSDDASGRLGTIQAETNIGPVKIGGSLTGGAGGISAGILAISGNISSVIIGDISAPGSITGGTGGNSGLIFAGKNIGAVTITGDVIGSGFSGTASIRAGGDLGAVKILGDLIGGSASNSGWITAGGKLKSFTLGDSIDDNLVGGTGAFSGIVTSGGAMGAVKIAGSIIGNGANSGAISADGKLASITLGGSLIGGEEIDGSSDRSGFIGSTTSIGSVKIAGSVIGGGGNYSATITSGGKIGSVSIGGQLKGGAGADSGVIFSSIDDTTSDDLGSVTISHGIVGGAGPNSGSVIADGRILNISLGSESAAIPAAIQGGTGTYSGSIFSSATIGTVKIIGDILGGGAANSGSIQATGNLTSVNVIGSVFGGTADFTGSILSHDATSVDGPKPGNIGKVTVSGALVGGVGFHSGAIEAEGNLGTVTVGSISDGGVFAGTSLENFGSAKLINVKDAIAAGTIEVDGSVSALKVKTDVTQSAIRASDAIKSITIGGNLEQSLISAGGAAVAGRTDVAIGSIKIGGKSATTGNVTDSQILGGYDLDGVVNPHAQIGSVSVTHNWTASDLVAGVTDVDADGFGDLDDALIFTPGDTSTVIARIASITIGGTVSGTPDAVSTTDQFGFIARQIGKFKSAAGSVPLHALTADVATFGTDVTLRDFNLPQAAPSAGVTFSGGGSLIQYILLPGSGGTIAILPGTEVVGGLGSATAPLVPVPGTPVVLEPSGPGGSAPITAPDSGGIILVNSGVTPP